jgi:hypothetical protein
MAAVSCGGGGDEETTPPPIGSMIGVWTINE